MVAQTMGPPAETKMGGKLMIYGAYVCDIQQFSANSSGIWLVPLPPPPLLPSR